MTITSSGNSGGGVGDFGVFHNEPVFTVYVETANSADDPAPTWTLEYAALDPAESAGLQPPFPKVKQMPEWPIDLATRYQGQMIVVYAVMDTEGKLQRMRVMQSPNLQFNQPLLDALEKWAFRPAKANGAPVEIKALLGVPIFPTEPAAGHSAAEPATGAISPGSK